jgi:hypothetical protein
MLNDELLHEWQEVKEVCKKVIDISINSNIRKTDTLKQKPEQFMKVYEYSICHSA